MLYRPACPCGWTGFRTVCPATAAGAERLHREAEGCPDPEDTLW